MAAAPEIHRWSPEDYHRLVDSGGLGESRVELIDGLILDMSPRSPAHDYAIQWLDRALHRSIGDRRFGVRANMALSLGDSEPEPDIAIVDMDADAPYHPATAALAIEVSHSSLRRELQLKPRIYAAAGIPRYWVIDLDQRRAVEHTAPVEDGYERVETVGRDGALAAPELGVSIALAELLAFALR